jgi:glycosyltransferase involved in cell wall biosynthesis
VSSSFFETRSVLFPVSNRQNLQDLTEMSVMVTLGLCVKNSEKTISDSINSIINQTYPPEFVQLVIVDGCSADNTVKILMDCTARTDARVDFYSDSGNGLGFARQIVVTNSVGKYLIFADGDVTLSSNFFTEQVKFMEGNPGVGVAYAKPTSRPYSRGTLVSNITALFNYADECSRGSTATIFRTEAVLQVGGFDISIKGAAEDIDLIARIQANGWSVSVNDKARFSHKFRESIGEFWREQTWFGYGSHYFNHKNKDATPEWRNLPFGYFIFTLRIAFKAYRLTLRKISFLIPLQMTLGNISWWFGFINAHFDGYGHNSRPVNS